MVIAYRSTRSTFDRLHHDRPIAVSVSDYLTELRERPLGLYHGVIYGVVCFSFFFWLRVLDKTEYSAFESTLNSSIVSYHGPLPDSYLLHCV